MSLKKIIYFSFFFLLFYLEPLSIGSLTIAQIWKILLYIAFGIYIFSNKTKNNLNNLTISLYQYALKDIFNLSFFQYPIIGFIHTLKFLNFPLLLHFLDYYINKGKSNLVKVYKFSYWLSVFIILSAVPFLLSILTPLGKAYDISAYSTEGSKGFVGLFQNSHSTSYFIAFAIINLIYFQETQKGKLKIFTFIIILFGSYQLLLTYVRGGMVVFFVGILFFYLSKISAKVLLRLSVISVIIMSSILYLINNNETFRRRLFDENEYNENTTETGKYGSGRLLFLTTNYAYFSQGEFITKIIGYGEELSRRNMEKKIGLKIYSHNGFMDAFLQNGVIGLFLFLKCFYFYYQIIKNSNKNLNLFRLCKANFFMFLSFQLFQGGVYFLFEVMISLNLSLLAHVDKLHIPQNNE